MTTQIIEKRVVVNKTVDGATKTINLQTVTTHVIDGVEMPRQYHRHVIAPGDDVSGFDAETQALAKAVWTPEVLAAYRAAKQE